MFRVTASRLRTWWSATTEDILGGDLNDHDAEIDYFRSHPHRRPLTPTVARRTGAVTSRPAHCLSPVRPAPVGGRTTPRTLSR